MSGQLLEGYDRAVRRLQTAFCSFYNRSAAICLLAACSATVLGIEVKPVSESLLALAKNGITTYSAEHASVFT